MHFKFYHSIIVFPTMYCFHWKPLFLSFDDYSIIEVSEVLD